jgi:hypothetical protein
MKRVPKRAIGYGLAIAGIAMPVLAVIILSLLPFTIALQTDMRGMMVLQALGIAGSFALTSGIWFILGPR